MMSMLLCVALSGCQTAKVTEPMSPETAGSDPDSQMNFWHTLPDRRLASNDDAFHAMLLFIDGSDPASDYDERVSTLKERRMLPNDFAGSANDAVKRGTLAVVIARVLDIKGGLSMRLLGPSPRYALRELQYMNLFPASSTQQTFSGQELLGIIGRVEDYQRQFNENALAEPGSEGDPTAPPRGPARGNAPEPLEVQPPSTQSVGSNAAAQ
jgi:hypothetical protein